MGGNKVHKEKSVWGYLVKTLKYQREQFVISLCGVGVYLASSQEIGIFHELFHIFLACLSPTQ